MLQVPRGFYLTRENFWSSVNSLDFIISLKNEKKNLVAVQYSSESLATWRHKLNSRSLRRKSNAAKDLHDRLNVQEPNHWHNLEKKEEEKHWQKE